MSVILQNTTRVTDFKTGEVMSETQVQKIAFPKEPAYVKLYLEDIGLIMGLSKKSTGLLYSLVKIMSYDGIIRVTKATKDRIGEEINVQDGGIRKMLGVFCSKGILKWVNTSEYEVNPNYFAKGDWTDIRKRQNDFEMKIKYTKNGREITGKAI